MPLTNKEKCAVCKAYAKWLPYSNDMPIGYHDLFYVTIRRKTFEDGQKTPMLNVALRECRMVYCPYCGTKLRYPKRKAMYNRHKVPKNDILVTDNSSEIPSD